MTLLDETTKLLSVGFLGICEIYLAPPIYLTQERPGFQVMLNLPTGLNMLEGVSARNMSTPRDAEVEDPSCYQHVCCTARLWFYPPGLIRMVRLGSNALAAQAILLVTVSSCYQAPRALQMTSSARYVISGEEPSTLS